MITLYTDGACLGNPGRGGWAAVLVEDGSKKMLHGSEERTTNNRMELTAVIRGLQAVPEGSQVEVFSDSQYVIKTMTLGWKRNVNLDLWDELESVASRRNVKWTWVKGHDGNPLNEEADAIAVREASMGHPRPVNPGSDPGLTHTDESGKASMVDVGWKPETERVAVARGRVVMKPETLELVKSNSLKKGDVLTVAQIAGIMGAKHTALLIPLCHTLPLDQVTVEFALDQESSSVEITATAKTTARTGVEMEAMTAVSVAALTVYDMCKAVDRGIRIEGIRLVKKTGGKSGDITLE